MTNSSCCRSRASRSLQGILPGHHLATAPAAHSTSTPRRLPRTVAHGSIPRHGEQAMGAYWVDILAVAFFALEWTVYAVTLEHTAYGRNSLSARMHRYREIWIRRLLDREARMVDMQVMASLQNGTAFFASTSLLAVGGGLALLRSTSEAPVSYTHLRAHETR